MKTMTRLGLVLACVFALVAVSPAQRLKFPPELDRLASKADEVVDVTMDRNMLNFASKFLSKDGDDREAKEIVSKLRGIYVKSFEFSKPGAYSPADIEAFRAQLKAPVWSKMMEARSQRDGENVEIYCKLENGAMGGLVIIAAEPKELTLVHIDGPLDPSQLGSLGGQFGIPKVQVNQKSQPAKPNPTAKGGKK